MTRLTGNEGTIIPLSEGKTMVSRHVTPPYAYFFGKNKLEQLLSQNGSMGIRIYYGADDKGKPALVLVSTDASGNDITSMVLDYGVPCPDLCPDSNSSLR